VLGAKRDGLANVDDWQLGEYFMTIEIKYLPAL